MNNHYRLLNEYTRYKNPTESRFAATTLTTSMGTFTCEKINDSVFVSDTKDVILDVKDVTHIRFKHDTILLCTKHRLVVFHGETRETYTMDIHYNKRKYTIHDMDVYFNPFRHEVRPWYLLAHKNKLVLLNNDVCVDKWYRRETGFERVDVLRPDYAIVSSDKKTRIYSEGRTQLFRNDTRVLETSYIYNLNRYLVQTNECFALLDDKQLEYMSERGIQSTMKKVDESNLFHTGGDCKNICFSKYQDVVLYACGRSHLCIAETKYPYNINPNIYLRGESISSVCLDQPNYKIYVETSENTYMFSMFPISLTASTNTDTIFE